jgi:tripartite-type tricarboxylate transporter receptor subunit TctC
VRYINTFPPGGPTDTLSRIVCHQLSEFTGQQFIVDNKAGSGGNVGTDAIAKSPPDGYTIGLYTIASQSIAPTLYAKLPFDAEKDFTPISMLWAVPNIFVTKLAFPANTVPELVALVKANPGKYFFGSGGSGTSPHLCGEMLKQRAGLDMQHVPYKGLVQGLQDIMTSRLDVMFAVIGGAAPQLKAGKMKGLAVSGRHRNPLIPDVPTFAEAGEPDFEASFYFGLAAPAGTPREMIAKFAAESAKIVNTAEVKEKYLANLGFEPVGDTPEQFAAFQRTEFERWKKLIADRKISAD